jgi:hypothetical protein
MKTLKIEIINPRAKNLLRELASLNLISIIPKRKTIAAAPKKENQKTGTTEKDDYPDWCRRMDEYQAKNGIPQLSEEELVAEIAADIKEYRREKYAAEGYI